MEKDPDVDEITDEDVEYDMESFQEIADEEYEEDEDA